MRFSQKKNYELKILILILIIVSITVIVGLYFHEPWFDEAQAWLIARDASWYDLFFVIPHYEGHPSLWHVILALPARMGFDYIISIKVIQFLTYEFALIFFLFKAPFRWYNKAILVCGYFFIYQYGVISRPYALMMGFIFLCAFEYKNRYIHPFRYMVLLMLLCSCHSYGIALAGGFVASDLFVVLFGNKYKGIYDFYKQHIYVFISHFILFVFSVCTIIQILPNADTYALGSGREHYIVSYLKCIFLIPSDCLFTSFTDDSLLMQSQTYPISFTISSVIMSTLIWFCVYVFAKRRKMRVEVFLPYGFLSVIMSVYIWAHHFGIFYMYLIYVLWILSDRDKIRIDEVFDFIHFKTLKHRKRLIVTGMVVLYFLIMNLYWDIFSYTYDINEAYDPSAEMAEWIKDNTNPGESFFSCWSRTDTNTLDVTVHTINAYFDHNIFYNTDEGKSYRTHRIASILEKQKDIEEWKKHEDPDYVIPYGIDADTYLDIVGIKSHYSIAYACSGCRVYKNTYVPSYAILHKKDDTLYDE